MDAVGLALSVAQTLFAALESSEIKHLLSIFGYESELEKLQSTVERITAVLQDAEGKEELTSQERDLVRKLKLAVYDADDLLDKFKTLAERDQLLLQVNKGGKLRRKVRRLISRFGKLGDAYDMAREVRRIAEELEGISSDANKFRIEVDNKPLKKRREETCSYVYQQDIIGREDDVNKVIDLLLAVDDDNVHGNISVVTIVGIGGLGKTALAQLVFNDDKRIKEHFTLRLWACVADEDGKFDVETILGKILKAATGERDTEKLGIEWLQRKVRDKLDGNKYLLVLDDVWTENRVEWMALENFLKGSGQRGSRIVVTTRSTETAKAVGIRAPYMLKGLSKEASWLLFKMVALGQEEELVIPAELFEIGRDIVQKCANVPLAIRVVGSLLFGQDKHKWLAIKEKGLSGLGGDKNDIKSILKFSYYHLESPLKSCFTYCALFLKDKDLEKQHLVSLWMAQGYLGDQNMEDVGEEYFSMLVRRCFFQDITNDKYGEIYSCRMHDLMHDVAQEIAGKEINNSSVDIYKETRHVLQQSREQNNYVLTPNRSRTYLHYVSTDLPLNAFFTKWKYLRSMDLQFLSINVLPGGIGDLLHLRYLNLSLNRVLEMLPDSFTKLHNLQTLHLKGCENFKELPHDLKKLLKLRVLDIEGCDKLSFMPSGMEKLTRLTQLSMFVLGGRNSSLKRQQRVGNIQDLQDLRNLKGSFEIRIMKDYAFVKGNAILCDMEYLKDISINWVEIPAETEGRLKEGKAEGILEALQPHRNIINLELCGYPGARMPGWAAGYNLISLFPSLTSIQITESPVLELPFMSTLRCLKTLRLRSLTKLECMEPSMASVRSVSSHREAAAGGSNSSAVEKRSTLFFPFLQELVFSNLPKLKGWWSEWRGDVRDDLLVADVDDNSYNMHFLEQLPSFPRLETLIVNFCPNLICMPLCPTVSEVKLLSPNEKLRIMAGDEGTCSTSSSEKVKPSLDKLPSQQKSENVLVYPRLRKFTTDNSGYFKCLPRSAIDCLEELIISCDERSTLSGLFGESLTGHPNSIRSLGVQFCPNLISLYGVLNHLSGLEKLELNDLPNLIFEDVDEDDMPWKSVANTLRTLKLISLPKVVKLPKGIRLLTSLRQLYIIYCPELEERCRSPDGVDYPIVKHVPVISFRYC